MYRKRVKKFQGVYYRESKNRTFNGKPDRCFDICYKDQNGKLIWEKIGWVSEGYTAAMASQIRSERLRSIRHGEELPKRKKKEITFGEAWERYNEWLETGKKRPRDDRYNYKNHLKDRFADKPLSKISPFDLERMKAELLKAGKSPATVKHCLVLVRQIINKAIAWGLWHGENPVKKVKMPRLNNQRVRFLSYEEANLLLDHLGKISPQVRDMALLSLHSGLRAGEIFNLRWQDIDPENGLIHVSDPKSGRSRKAFMTETVKRMFDSKQRGNPDELVFKNRKGEKITEISKTFSKVVKHLGFNDGVTDPRQRVTFHTLRHTFASWLAIQGTPILTIKELLGHQTLAMTERYSHLIPDNKIEAIAGLEQRFIRESKVVDIKVVG